MPKRWTEAERDQLAQDYRAEVARNGKRHIYRRLAKARGRSPKAIEHALARHPEWPFDQDIHAPPRVRPLTKSEVLTPGPVRPLAVPLPTPAIKVAGRFQTALLYGDSHHCYHSQVTLDTVLAILKDGQPDVVVDMGDGVDAALLSHKFKHAPTLRTTLQDEIDAKRVQLAQFREASPNATWIYDEGNHEWRLHTTMWSLEGPARELVRLDIVQTNLTWPKLLGLDDLHITFRPYDQQTQELHLPKFLLKHGSIVRKGAGNSGRGEMAKYNKSGSSAHCHNLSTIWRRDYDGQHLWVETGCTCDLNPPYTDFPDWQNGCVWLTFDTRQGAVQPEPIEIRQGTCMWRGQYYEPRT